MTRRKKINQWFLTESPWFFTIFILICGIFLFWLQDILGYQLFAEATDKIFLWQYWGAISTITLVATATFIAIQAFATQKLAEISYLPSVTFIFKSGNTWQRQKGNENPSLQEKLDTRRIVINKSKFPICFWLRGSLKVVYKDTSQQARNERIYDEWRVYPESILDGHDSGNMLCTAIFKKKPEEIDWQQEVQLQQEMDKIESITARIKTSYAPAIRKKSPFHLEAETWSFDLEKLKWIDPLGTSDDRILI